MSLNWLICLVLLWIIPAIMIFCGIIRQKSCTKPGSKFGYTTKLSLSSPDAWAHAQSVCPKRYLIAGGILAVVALLLMLLALGANNITLFVYSITIALLELLVWGAIVISVESSLRNLLGVKE